MKNSTLKNISESIKIELNSKLVLPIYAISILSIFSFFNGCSNSKENNRLRKELKVAHENINKLDSLIDTDLYNKKEIKTILEIQGLENSKRTLRDMNTIVLTKNRPDSQIKEYDESIKALEEKL